MPRHLSRIDDPVVIGLLRTPSVIARAALLALALCVATGMPGPGAETSDGPGASVTRVATAGAASYIRVTSLHKATRATWITIPRLHISMPIRQAVLTRTISRRYAYHYPSTSWPGGHSNTYLYAHAQVGAFLNLWYARKGDIITLRLSTGRYVRYRVKSKFTVAWNDLRWLRLTSTERLTLQTCTGNTRTARRLIVIAVPAY